MINLSVNVNKFALLRNARGGGRPNVLDAARFCIARGCHGITVHPRPDERHIRRSDVHEIGAAIDVEFNIEGYPSQDWIELVLEMCPAQATLVPDAPGQLTSDHGWDLLAGQGGSLPGILARFRDAGIRTSLFVDPDPKQVARVPATGADRIELYTESYAAAFGTTEQEVVLARFVETAEAATELGLGINAGHDLNLSNLPEFARRVSGLAEVSIGHAIVCDALDRGLGPTLDAYLEALRV